MVNTFLPYADFHQCARVLDWKRLGKQRVEARQIVNAIIQINNINNNNNSSSNNNNQDNHNIKLPAWRNHPATQMWKDHLPALKYYTNIMIKEWISRGYNNTMPLYSDIPQDMKEIDMPWFINWSMLHWSHQALLRKDYQHYAKYFQNNNNNNNIPKEYMKRSYIWPSHLTVEQMRNLKKDLLYYRIDVITKPHVDANSNQKKKRNSNSSDNNVSENSNLNDDSNDKDDNRIIVVSKKRKLHVMQTRLDAHLK